MLIEDGKGRGYKTAVDSENRAETSSVTRSTAHHSNMHEGQAYHALFDQSPTANNDCIFYMVNSHTTDRIVVEGVWLSVDAACEVYFKANDKGTRNSATAVTPVNCNFGSGNAAEGTFEQGVDLDGGAATLTGGTEFERYVFTAGLRSTYFRFDHDIIIPRNQTMTIWCTSSAATVNGTVVFNYHLIN
jgi:hypothetical protein